MFYKLKAIVFSALLWMAVSSCGFADVLLEAGSGLPSPTLQPSPAKVLTLNPASTRGLLPNSLYFLGEVETGSIQVWRMEADGSMLTQITNEAAGVNDYDLSRVNDRLAYISENKLYIAESDGGDKQLIFDGGEDGGVPGTRFHSLRWSADGKMLAFGHGGIYIYSPDTGSLVKALPDEVISSGVDENQPEESEIVPNL